MSENPVVRLIPEFARYRLESVPDGELLEQYVRSREEDAFAELVRRHGGMVLGVCRRVLRNTADAEDAFQAAFLVLARRAAAIQPPGAVGAWLHGVAFRTAREALKRAARRLKHEGRATPREPTPEPMPNDFRPVLDAELDRLPRPYAEVLVLCDMEDRPRREVAALLGVPEGTIASRLSRARDMLAERLNRRGLGVTAGVLASALSADARPVPLALVQETTRAARGAASASVSELAMLAARTFSYRSKIAAGVALFAALGIAGWAAGNALDRNPRVPPPDVQVQLQSNPETVAEAPPPVEPLERAKSLLTGMWRLDSGTKDGQPLSPWEKQGIGIHFASDASASLNRLQIGDAREFTWTVENSRAILLTPKVKSLAQQRIAFEFRDDSLLLAWSEPGARGGPRSPYGSGSFQIVLKRSTGSTLSRLSVTPSPQNAVGNGLIGEWEWDADLNRKLGNAGTPTTRLTFTRDDTVADELPPSHRDLFEGKRIYLAGHARVRSGTSYRFLLVEHLGNPMLVYFVPKPGDDWHCEEAAMVNLATGAKSEQDLLFLKPFEGAKFLSPGAFRRAVGP